MLRTRIPVTVWEEQGPTVVATAVDMLVDADGQADQADTDDEFWEAVGRGHDPRVGLPD